MDSTVLIRIRHRDIDPAILTEVFGIVPEYSWKAGEAKPGSNQGATRRESYWVAQVPPSFGSPWSQWQGSAEPGAARAAQPGAQTRQKEAEIMPAYGAHTPLERALTFAVLPFMLNWRFWSELQAEGATGQLIVVFGSDSLADFDLPSEIMSTLSKYGLSLSVSFRDADEAAA